MTHDCLPSTPLYQLLLTSRNRLEPQGVRARSTPNLLVSRRAVAGSLWSTVYEARHNRARRRPPAIERGRRERFGVQRESCVVVVVVFVADVRQKRVVDVPETSFAFASSRRRRLRLHGELRKGFEDW